MTDEKTPQTRLARLQEAAEQNPTSAQAQAKLGTALIKAGLVRKAKAVLERAVELDPSSPEAWVNLGGVYFSCWDFPACVEANRKAVALKGDLLQAHYNLGLAHLYCKQPQEMVAAFARVLELDPDNAAGHYHLAVGLQALGRTDEAHSHLQSALELGHAPQPEFVRELAKANDRQAREQQKQQQQQQDNKAPVQVLEFGPDAPGDSKN